MDPKKEEGGCLMAATPKSHKASDVQAVQETNTAYLGKGNHVLRHWGDNGLHQKLESPGSFEHSGRGVLCIPGSTELL